MMTIHVSDSVTPDLKAKIEKLSNPRPLMAAAGKSLETALKTHFNVKNSKPNKREWPSQNFWAQIAKATSLSSVMPTTATVTVADERINPHVYGGEIKPKSAKMLAIPARQEAAGIRPSSGQIPGLHVIVLQGARGSIAALVQRDMTSIRIGKDTRKGRDGQQRVSNKGEQGGGVFYWLVPSVTIPRDPDALPSDETLNRAVGATVTEWCAVNLKGS